MEAPTKAPVHKSEVLATLNYVRSQIPCYLVASQRLQDLADRIEERGVAGEAPTVSAAVAEAEARDRDYARALNSIDARFGLIACRLGAIESAVAELGDDGGEDEGPGDEGREPFGLAVERHPGAFSVRADFELQDFAKARDLIVAGINGLIHSSPGASLRADFGE